MEPPKFSIVIPVYGAEKYLPACINSVLSQDYTNFELVLVDDASPDKCPQICDDFAAADSRVRIIHQKNQGISGACNSGIAASKGEYIIQLDNDDYLVQGILAKVNLCIAQNNSPDIVQCNWSQLTEDTLQESVSAHLPTTQAYAKLSRLGRIVDNVEHFTFPVPFWTRAVRTEYLKCIGFAFNTRYDGIQDLDGMVQCYLGTDSIAFLNTPMSVHRQRNNSASSATSEKFIINNLAYIDDWFDIEKHCEASKCEAEAWKTFLANGVAAYALNVIYTYDMPLIKKVYALIDTRRQIFKYFTPKQKHEKIIFPLFKVFGCRVCCGAVSRARFLGLF